MFQSATDHFGKISVTEEQVDLLNQAQKFAREKSPMKKVRKLIESDEGYDLSVWQVLIYLGWLGIAIPDDFGGSALSLAEVVPVVEQMGRYMLTTPFLTTTLAAQVILQGGTEAQKSRLLPKIIKGKVVTLGLTDLDGDWHFMQTKAVLTPDKEGFSLSGTKTFVMDIPQSDYVIVNASLDSGTVLVIIPTNDIPKQNIRRENLVDETKRGYELKLDGVKVAADALLDRNKILATLDYLHLAANLLISAELCGGAAAVIQYTVDYLTTRKQFGKLIGSYQALKHPTVDAFVESEKARSLLYAAAHSFAEQGKGEIATRMSMVQSETALSFAADRSIQFHGGFGFTYDCDAQLYRRRAIFGSSQYGNAAFHKKKLAALLL